METHALRSWFALLVGWLGCTGTSYSQQTSRVPIITVCEGLRSLDHYRGRTVVLVGNSGGTFEGTFMDEPCEPDKRVLIDGRRWLSMVQVRAEGSEGRQEAAAAFPVEEDVLLRKLKQVKGYSGGSATEVWGDWDAVYGKIQCPVRLKQRPVPGTPRGTVSDDRYLGNGYGANGTVPAIIRATQIKTLVRGRSFVLKRSLPVPDLPDPPALMMIEPVSPSAPLPTIPPPQPAK